MDDLVEKSCEQMTRQLLVLAQTFARKSRRLSTQLTSTDLINAFQCMNILYKSKEDIFEINSFNSMFDIEYK